MILTDMRLSRIDSSLIAHQPYVLAQLRGHPSDAQCHNHVLSSRPSYGSVLVVYRLAELFAAASVIQSKFPQKALKVVRTEFPKEFAKLS